MRHRKKAVVCLMAAAILTGCGQSGSAPATDIQTAQKTPAIAIGVIEAYPLEIKGKFGYQDVVGGKIETGEKEYSFTGHPTDINITSTSPGVMEIESVVADDFFKTAAPVKIVYEYDNDLVMNATIEDNGNFTIKPTQPFDFEMFYDEGRGDKRQGLKLKFQKKVEKTIENPIGRQNEEIPITKENIEKIEYSYNIEYPGVSKARTGRKSDFGYNGGILFTCKNGDKYECSTYLYYKPFEKKMYSGYKKGDKSPVWDIEISSPKKIN